MGTTHPTPASAGTPTGTGRHTGRHSGTGAGRAGQPRNRLRLLAIATLVVLVAAGVLGWRLHTATGTAPYADPAVTGRLTLCSADGRPLTSGSVTGRPFVAAVVGRLATGPYARGGTVTLLAAQPRAGVDAAEWSTLQLTAAQPIADPGRPTVRPDAGSTTLGQFLTAYPASDHGWVQLRLVLGGVDVPAQTQSYAAVDLHVSGGTWTLADPGSASCSPPHS